MTAIEKHQGSESMTREQVELLKRTICRGATDDELRLFVSICESTGLDPFRKQIYSIERRSKDHRGNWVTTRDTQTSIDGYRLIAERTGDYAGQVGPFWCGDDGVWRDVWLEKKAPTAARVGVLRHSWKEPLFRNAIWSEYVQTKKGGDPTAMWRKMPSGMLAKCAEALALRAAFPQELGGLYTREEMGQAEQGEDSGEHQAPEVEILPPTKHPLVERIEAMVEPVGAGEIKAADARQYVWGAVEDAKEQGAEVAVRQAMTVATRRVVHAVDPTLSKDGVVKLANRWVTEAPLERDAEGRAIEDAEIVDEDAA